MKKQNHAEGYILVYQPEHPSCQKAGYIPEHRYVIEKSIGRYTKGTEVIHHINGIRSDNRLKNLMLLKDQCDHKRIHEGWIKKNNKWFKTCSGCQSYLEVNTKNFFIRKSGKMFYVCKKCASLKSKKWYLKNREKGRASAKKYYNARKDIIKKKVREYRQKNKDEVNRKQREYRRKKNEEKTFT